MPDGSVFWLASADPRVIHSPRPMGLAFEVGSIQNHLYPVSDTTFLS